MPKPNRVNQSHDFKYFSLAACCILLAVFAARAQTPGPDEVIQSLEARTSYKGDLIRQGSTFRTAITFELKSDYRTNTFLFINSNEPLSAELSPTKIEVLNASELEGLVIGAPLYPKSEKLRLKFSNEPLALYSRRISIQFDSQTSRNMPVGEYKLRVMLTYQACTDQGCAPTQTRLILIPFEIVDPHTKVEWDHNYFPKMRLKDYLLIPVRIAQGKVLPDC